MPGRAGAVASGRQLEEQVVLLGAALGLESRRQYKLGRRIWGAERRIDVVLTEPQSRRRLGVECKFQDSSGSAEEKIPLTLQDIAVWPIPGIVVFAGQGLTPNMVSYLLASGRAMHVDDLESWLRLYFGLELV